MLNCRNNGVKDVAYKCYASITLGGAEGGGRWERGARVTLRIPASGSAVKRFIPDSCRN